MFASINKGVKYIDRGLVEAYDFPIGDFVKDGNWHEIDLSLVIGKGVKFVGVSIGMKVSEDKMQMALRTCGQVGTKNFASMFAPVGGTMAEHTLWVTTDKDGKVDYYCTSGTWTNLQFVIRGWFV